MTKKQVDKLKQAFADRFDAKVEAEKIAPGRYRFSVVSDRFKRRQQLQRQDDLWKVADEILPRQATVDISLILAYAPDELETAA